MTLFPNILHFIDLNCGSQMQLDDSIACSVHSAKNINIQAVGNVVFSGKTISVYAPEEISIAKKDMIQSTVVNLCNNVDTIGGIANFETTRKGMSTIMPVTSFGKYNMDDLESDILSTMPIRAQKGSLICMIRISGWMMPQ